MSSNFDFSSVSLGKSRQVASGDNELMLLALREAKRACLRGSVPVGAVIVHDDSVVSKASNEVLQSSDPTAHAEILAIRQASFKLKAASLSDCDIYVTLEPCAMCAEAISLARIRRLYFGAYNPKYGAVVHGCRVFNYSLHKPRVIGGVFESQCREILCSFFERKRN